MTPFDAIAMIDRQFIEHAQDATLRLSLGTTPPTYANVDVLAFVRGYRPDELVGTLQQGDRRVILRNTEVAAGGHRAPREGDRLVLAGATTTVLASEARRVANTVVSHWLTVRG